jgi:hypothetical protein
VSTPTIKDLVQLLVAMASPNKSQTQYQHYIPQFILKNFSHKYHPPPDESKSAARHREKEKETRLYPDDLVLNVVVLKDEVAHITESPVKRTFGLMSMYMDISNAADHNFLERELGKLESRVSRIIAEIRKALESGKEGFSMSRDQKDLLRKFLFVMKYRGPGYYRRFHGDEHGDYHEDDEGPFKEYMAEKGFRKPVDVWFQSIKTILELDVDLEGKWQKKLLSRIYPYDALGFIMHMEWYFLAFCTPEDSKNEFLLTENCYNVFEGSSSTAINPETGEYEAGSWTSFHEFSPITPKLLLVLRSVLVPNSEEDANENMRNWRESLQKASASLHINPPAVKSMLQDLPARKPRNSYSHHTTEGIQLLPGEDGSRRSSHRFTFPFFKIKKDLVFRINAIIIDNAHSTSMIAFRTEDSLKDSLQYYLQVPAGQGFKVILPHEKVVRLNYLKKLHSVSKTLGSNVTLTYEDVPGMKELEILKKKEQDLQREMLEHLPEQPTEFMQLYHKLGS